MKGVFIILDGIGDLPCKQLDGKTPLEAAETPNLDFLSARSDFGYLYPVKPGYAPGSDEAILSIFGNSKNVAHVSRGWLEALGTLGTRFKLTKGDLVFRVNFATVDEKRNIIDRRVGRTLTTREAEKIAKSLNKINLEKEFIFRPAIQHRAVLVFKGNFSDKVSGNDNTYSHGKIKQQKKAGFCKPLENTEKAIYTANIVNEFLEKAYNVLAEHPVNVSRKKRGLLPANALLLRGAGIEIPKLRQYKKWVALGYMPLEIGFSEASGMKVVSFRYPKLKGIDVYRNLYDGLKKACKMSIKLIKRNYKKYDYAYIHIKETDIPGHDNKPLEKKMMIEYIDKTLFYFLRKFAPYKKVKILITGDHSTPCKMKNHTADPVPVMFYPAVERKPEKKRFTEKDAKKGVLGRMIAEEVLKKTDF